ncbi:MAG: diaminopimelate epimerase [Cellulosilyticaceae bacterium]
MKRVFAKMQGCGNDYIYFNCLEEMIDQPEEVSKRLSHRHFGVGGDGIILICPSDRAVAKMRIFNADGSEAKMCGNGIRCVGKYLYDHHLACETEFEVDTLSGIKVLSVFTNQGKVNQVRVDMGSPILKPEQIPVNWQGEAVLGEPLVIDDVTYFITCVSTGNPHCIVFVDDVDTIDLEKIGPLFEKHPLFPEQVNAEFVKIISPHELQMRVWERGSGETFACGTGACASVVASVLNGYCNKNEEVRVKLLGGDLRITYTEDTVYMTGEAVQTFEGVVEV